MLLGYITYQHNVFDNWSWIEQYTTKAGLQVHIPLMPTCTTMFVTMRHYRLHPPSCNMLMWGPDAATLSLYPLLQEHW